MFLRLFYLLPKPAATAFTATLTEPPAKAVVEQNEEVPVAYSMPNPEITVSMLVKRKNEMTSAASKFRFHGSGHINILHLRMTGSISMTPSQKNSRQHLLTNFAMFQMLNAMEKQ